MSGGLPEVSAALPDVTSAKTATMRAISDDMSLKGVTPKKADIALKGMPGKSRADRKPYAPAGFEWHAQSKGFTCRRIVKEGGKRRRVYVGFLNGKAWADMQSRHSGPELKQAVKAWIESRR